MPLKIFNDSQLLSCSNQILPSQSFALQPQGTTQFPEPQGLSSTKNEPFPGLLLGNSCPSFPFQLSHCFLQKDFSDLHWLGAPAASLKNPIPSLHSTFYTRSRVHVPCQRRLLLFTLASVGDSKCAECCFKV